MKCFLIYKYWTEYLNLKKKKKEKRTSINFQLGPQNSICCFSYNSIKHNTLNLYTSSMVPVGSFQTPVPLSAPLFSCTTRTCQPKVEQFNLSGIQILKKKWKKGKVNQSSFVDHDRTFIKGASARGLCEINKLRWKINRSWEAIPLFYCSWQKHQHQRDEKH